MVQVKNIIGIVMADPSSPSENGSAETIVTICKYCGEIVKTKWTCIKCKHKFHPSCFNRANQAKNRVCFHEKESESTTAGNISGPELSATFFKSQDFNNIIKEAVHDATKSLQQFFDKNFQSLNHQMNELLSQNKKFQEEIMELKNDKNKVSDKQSYADVIDNNRVLIIKPKEIADKGAKNDKTAIKVRENLRQQINPGKIGVGITMGKTTRNGEVILQCNTEQSLSKLQNSIQANLGEKYSVAEKELNKNRLKIISIHESEYVTNDDELIHKILNQNDLELDSSEIKVIHRSKIVNQKFNLIVEVNKYLYHKLILQSRIFVGWSRCRFFEDFGILRCFKCNKFGHTASKCTGDTICPRCAGRHKHTECKLENKTLVKCINCFNANKKYQLNLNIDHEAWNKECASFKRVMKLQKQKFTNTVHQNVNL